MRPIGENQAYIKPRRRFTALACSKSAHEPLTWYCTTITQISPASWRPERVAEKISTQNQYPKYLCQCRALQVGTTRSASQRSGIRDISQLSYIRNGGIGKVRIKRRLEPEARRSTGLKKATRTTTRLVLRIVRLCAILFRTVMR